MDDPYVFRNNRIYKKVVENIAKGNIKQDEMVAVSKMKISLQTKSMYVKTYPNRSYNS